VFLIRARFTYAEDVATAAASHQGTSARPARRDEQQSGTG
jgi:hypothetical protein